MSCTLRGLTSKVDIFRRPEEQVAGCILTPDASCEEMLYRGACARLYDLDEDKLAPFVHGMDVSKMRGATLYFSNRVEECDYVRVTWGDQGNLKDYPVGPGPSKEYKVVRVRHHQDHYRS